MSNDENENENLLKRKDSALVYGVSSPILKRIRDIQAKMLPALEEAGYSTPPDNDQDPLA